MLRDRDDAAAGVGRRAAGRCGACPTTGSTAAVHAAQRRAVHRGHRRRGARRRPARRRSTTSSRDEIRRALLEWKVLFFRDQHLTSEQQLAFALEFGELEHHPFLRQGDAPEIVRFEKGDDRARPVRGRQRERLAQRRHVARGAGDGRGSARGRGARARRRHVVGRHGLRVRQPSRTSSASASTA